MHVRRAGIEPEALIIGAVTDVGRLLVIGLLEEFESLLVVLACLGDLALVVERLGTLGQQRKPQSQG